MENESEIRKTLKWQILQRGYRLAMAAIIARLITISLMIGCITTAVIYFSKPWLLLCLSLPALMTPSAKTLAHDIGIDDDD